KRKRRRTTKRGSEEDNGCRWRERRQTPPEAAAETDSAASGESGRLNVAALNIGKQINDLIEKESWAQARSLIEKALVSEPNSHWLLTQLGETFYEEMEYRKALHYLLKSRDIV